MSIGTFDKCRSCGAAIVWVKHRETRRAAPINAEADPAGNLIVTADMFGDATYWTATDADAGIGDRYTSHFATCPNARAWRGSNRP